MEERSEVFDANDFAVDDIYAATLETFDPHDFHYAQLSSFASAHSGSTKPRRAVLSPLPWRFCLAQLQRCTDASNRARFKALISKYSETHAQQRKAETLRRAQSVWTDVDERYANPSDQWCEIETDLITREASNYSFVNILVKDDPNKGNLCRSIRRINGTCDSHPEHVSCLQLLFTKFEIMTALSECNE